MVPYHTIYSLLRTRRYFKAHYKLYYYNPCKYILRMCGIAWNLLKLKLPATNIKEMDYSMSQMMVFHIPVHNGNKINGSKNAKDKKTKAAHENQWKRNENLTFSRQEASWHSYFNMEEKKTIMKRKEMVGFLTFWLLL